MTDERSTSPTRRLPTGIAGLDPLLYGGYLRGGLYLIVGGAGSGKTIMTSQTAFRHATDGEHVASITVLGETTSRRLDHLRPFGFFDESAVGSTLMFYSEYGTLRDGGLPALTRRLEQTMRADRASLLILDGFPLDVATPGDLNSVVLSECLHTLQAASELLRFTTLITVPACKGIWSSHALLFADGVFALRRHMSHGVVTRTLDIKKFRGSRYHEGMHGCAITEAGMVLVAA